MRKSSAGSFGASPAGTEARWLRGAAGRPLPAGETKQNETKRNKTKNNERKHRRSRYRAPHPAPRYRGPGLPARPGPVCPDWAWRSRAAGPDPAAAGKRAFPCANACRTGCGELGRSADWPVAGLFAGAPAGGTGGAGGCRVGRLRVRRMATVRPGRRGRRRLREGCGVAEANLPSATRPGPREALAGTCWWGGEAGPAEPHMSALAGAGPSYVRAGARGARWGGGPYLPTRA